MSNVIDITPYLNPSDDPTPPGGAVGLDFPEVAA